MSTPAGTDSPFTAAEERIRAWDHPVAADLLRVIAEVRAIRADMDALRDEVREVRAEQGAAAVREARVVPFPVQERAAARRAA